MKRYIALLRGINISGKNKIAMSELKQGFESLSYENVRTYLNSGNVVFSADEDIPQIKEEIEAMIRDRFELDIPVFVITVKEVRKILDHAPDWWGNEDKEIYDNLIFILPPYDAVQIHEEIGEPKEGLERIEEYGNVIFWSFSRKDYQKTNWWPRTAAVGTGSKMTIRTANTVRKLADM